MRATWLIGIGGMSSLMVAGLAPPSSGRPRVSARAPAAPAMFTDVYGDNDAGLMQIPTRLTQHRLLRKEEERDITNDVRELRRWSAVREDLERSLGQPPTPGEWASSLGFTDVEGHSAANQLHLQLQGKRAARDRLIQSNLRLVVSVALKYKGRGVPLQDLVQDGTVGLITAAEKFEPSKGWRFSTYAHWWIRQAISRSIDQHGRMIRVPSYMVSRIHTIRRARAVSYYATGKTPGEEEIHAELHRTGAGLSERQMRGALQADATTRSCRSLYTTFGRGDERSLLTTLPDEKTARPLQAVEQTAVQDAMELLLESTLSPEERRVIELNFGLAGNEAHTVPQVAAVRGCSQNEVRADLGRALRKLRRKGRALGLAAFAQ